MLITLFIVIHLVAMVSLPAAVLFWGPRLLRIQSRAMELILIAGAFGFWLYPLSFSMQFGSWSLILVMLGCIVIFPYRLMVRQKTEEPNFLFIYSVCTLAILSFVYLCVFYIKPYSKVCDPCIDLIVLFPLVPLSACLTLLLPIVLLVQVRMRSKRQLTHPVS